jgi:hypothetical protein
VVLALLGSFDCVAGSHSRTSHFAQDDSFKNRD